MNISGKIRKRIMNKNIIRLSYFKYSGILKINASDYSHQVIFQHQYSAAGKQLGHLLVQQ